MDFNGKVIESLTDEGDCFRLICKDGSQAKIEVSYENCFYESDVPGLKMSVKPSEADILAIIAEIEKWFKTHKSNTRYFRLSFGEDRYKRGNIEKQVRDNIKRRWL